MPKKVEAPKPILSGWCNPASPPWAHARCKGSIEAAPGLRPGVMHPCPCLSCQHGRCRSTVQHHGLMRCVLEEGHSDKEKHRQRPRGVSGIVW